MTAKHEQSLAQTDHKTQREINTKLEEAISSSDWESVKELCLADNVPSQDLVDIQFQTNFHKMPINIVSFLFETSKVNPSSLIICRVLNQLLGGIVPEDKWPIIEYFCGLKKESKLSNIYIGWVLEKAVEAKQESLAQKLIQMQEDNAPSCKVLLGLIADKDRSLTLDCLQLIVAKSKNRPTQEDISEVILSLRRTNSKKEFISHLCSLTTDNKPRQSTIAKVLAAAVHVEDWDFVKDLCILKSDNAPSQEDVDKVLERAGRKLPPEILTCLFKSATNPPSQAGIRSLIHEFLNLYSDKNKNDPRYWQLIDYLWDKKDSEGLESQSESMILLATTRFNYVAKMEMFCQIKGDKAFAPTLFATALQKASSSNSVEIVRCILKYKIEELSQSEIDAALSARNDLQVITCFCELKTKKPGQKTIIELLKYAANGCDHATVFYLRQNRELDQITLDEILVELMSNENFTNQLDSNNPDTLKTVKALCSELKMTKPSQNAIAKAADLVRSDKIRAYLDTLISDPRKQSKGLQQANSERSQTESKARPEAKTKEKTPSFQRSQGLFSEQGADSKKQISSSTSKNFEEWDFDHPSWGMLIGAVFLPPLGWLYLLYVLALRCGCVQEDNSLDEPPCNRM